ncbi:MAG: hypothetical protein US54_C0057G0005, partial [Candidatus Roizmanbacteria bacterium GW2011_GWA2_37_7]
SSNKYFKNIIGTVFFEDTRGCFDICIIPTYKKLKGSDSSTFRVLSYKGRATYYAKDKYHVFLNDKILKDADPNTIQLANPDVAFDANAYYLGATRLPDYLLQRYSNTFQNDTEIKVLSVLPNSTVLFISRGKLYNLRFSSSPFYLQELNIIDGNTFVPNYQANGNNNTIELPAQISLYPTIDNPIYIGYDKNFDYIEINDGIDIAHNRNKSLLFQKFGTGYSQVNQKIYFLTDAIEAADPLTFAYTGKDFQDSIDRKAYSKDKNHIFFGKEIIANADPKSFTIIYSTGSNKYTYAFDNNGRYQLGKQINTQDTEGNKLFDSAYENRISLIR